MVLKHSTTPADLSITYTRVSEDKQSGGSSQLENLRRLARLHGLETVAEIEDDDLSGDDLDRAGLNDVMALLERAHAGKRPISWLLVDQSDRLSRADSLDTSEVLARMRRLGVRKVATPARVFDLHSAMDRTLLLIEGDHKNNSYLKDLGRRVLNGMLDSARAGFWTAQKPPLGYVVVRTPGDHGGRRRHSGRLALDPETAPVVRELFERYRDGASTRDLARWLSARTGKKLTRQGVQRILQRETYTGTRVFGDRTSGRHARLVDGQAQIISEDEQPEAVGTARLAVGPAIVDMELFAQVKQRLAGGRTRGRKKGVPLAPLAGLCRCGACGAPMRSSRQGVYPYLLCARHDDAHGRCERSVYACGDVVLRRVLATLAKEFHDDAVERLVELTGKAEDEARAAWEANVVAVEKTLSATNERLATARRRLLDVAEDLREDYERLVRELKDEKAGVEVELAQLRAEQPAVEEGDGELLIRWLELCRQACDSDLGDGPEANALLRELIDHIRVFPPEQPKRGNTVGEVEVVLPEWLSRVLATIASRDCR